MIEKYISNINSFSDLQLQNELNISDTEYKSKLLSIKSEKKKRQSLTARILLRKAISEIYGINDYRIKYTENGKPYLPFCNFSISHSDDIAVCVVSDREIGVDTEKIRSVKERKYSPFLTDDEIRYINSGDDFSYRFLYVWTRKEAYIKCKALSLSDISSFSVLSDREDVIFETEVNSGYIISVCKCV